MEHGLPVASHGPAGRTGVLLLELPYGTLHSGDTQCIQHRPWLILLDIIPQPGLL